MPAGVETLTTGLPEEFSGPVAYGDRWLWFALLGVLLVILYYVAVLWLTRTRRTAAAGGSAPADVPSARRLHLERIDRIEADVRSGRLSARDGHQQLSEAVRSYVGAVSPLPAPTMALADFRAHAPQALTDAIEVMYPPEFAPDDVGQAHERFDDALHRGRRLVTSWS
jgi:hypothetical protein